MHVETEKPMAGYTFEPDEYVILKSKDVHLDSDSIFDPPDVELMLTNRNIVLPRKSIFGKIKGYTTYPLSDIRIVDGVPQCCLDITEILPHLDVYFNDSQASFVFMDEQAVVNWVDEIHKQLVGHEAPESMKITAHSFGLDFEELNGMVDSMGSTFGSLTNAFERKRRENAPVVASTCPNCCASLKGRKGETVNCPYCGSSVTIA